MLYLVAHSFFNGQSKNSNLFPLPELHETQFKKKPWSSGDENVYCVTSDLRYAISFFVISM